MRIFTPIIDYIMDKDEWQNLFVFLLILGGFAFAIVLLVLSVGGITWVWEHYRIVYVG